MVSLSGLTLEPKARPITGHYSKAVLYIAEDAIRDTLDGNEAGVCQR